MSEDTITTPTEIQSVAQVPGEPYRASECCLASVSEHVTTHQETPEGTWQGVHFTCDSCGRECRPHTNPTIVALLQENRRLRGQSA